MKGECLYMSTSIDIQGIKITVELEIDKLKKCTQDDDREYCANLQNKYAMAYNKLGIAILGTPMLPKKPIDPFVAAAAGNSLGGVAVGVTAGMSAIEKKKAYDKALADFTSTQIGINGALEELAHWHALVEEYINAHSYEPDAETQKRLSERDRNLNSIKKADLARLIKEKETKKEIVKQNTYKLFGKGAKAKRDANKRLIEIEREITKLQSQIIPEE